MKKIPTAGEFLEMHPQISHYYDDKLKLMVVPEEQVYQAMIEFAKLHVEAALKAKVEAMEKYMCDGFSSDEIDSFTHDAYPLTDIK